MQTGEQTKFLKRLNSLFEKNNISNYRMSKDTGIPEATIGRWRNGAASPNAKNIQIISDYFSVSVDYILGIISENQSIFDSSVRLIHGYPKDSRKKISPQDKRILEQIDNLSEESKAKIREYIGLLELKEKQKKGEI